MNILIVAATPYEIAPLHTYLKDSFVKSSPIIFKKNELKIHLLLTGIGMTHTAYAMGRYMGSYDIDFAVNMGIGGALHKGLELGEVLHVVQEEFGDLGIEQADGSFQTLFESELMDTNQFPFIEGVLKNDSAKGFEFLKKAKGISVNTVHGFPNAIAAFKNKYPHADLESMEGASFFYVCQQEEIPFIQIRAISNYVEQRNKAYWKIPLAIDNLNKTIISMIEDIYAKIMVEINV